MMMVMMPLAACGGMDGADLLAAFLASLLKLKRYVRNAVLPQLLADLLL